MLHASEYAVIVEQAPILIWRADLSMGCDYFNERWLEFTGRELAQELGNGWSEGVHPDDLSRCLEVYTSAFRARRPFEMEYRLRRGDGAWRWLFDRGAPFVDAGGAFAGYIGSCVDVTERVEAERVLAERRERELLELRALVPICARCKNVRADDGFWERVETYVTRVTHRNFTHGLCEDCLEALYGGGEGGGPPAGS
jgi:PAS domain S-box-containing protein